MKRIIFLSIVLTSFMTHCKESHQPQSSTTQTDAVVYPHRDTATSQKSASIATSDFIDSEYHYVDATGKQVTVINSLPKGGLKYTDSKGEEYVYAVFWTQIVNETAEALELTMNCFENSYQLPSSPTHIFKLYTPSDTFTIDKIPLFNFGVNLEQSLYHHQQPNDVQRTVDPNSTGAFYVIVLFNKGVNGTVRAGLRFEGQQAVYRVNDKIIDGGYINYSLAHN